MWARSSPSQQCPLINLHLNLCLISSALTDGCEDDGGLACDEDRSLLAASLSIGAASPTF